VHGVKGIGCEAKEQANLRPPEPDEGYATLLVETIIEIVSESRGSE